MRLGSPQTGSCRARWRNCVSPAMIACAVRRMWRKSGRRARRRPPIATAMNGRTLAPHWPPGLVGFQATRAIGLPCGSAMCGHIAVGLWLASSAGRKPDNCRWSPIPCSNVLSMNLTDSTIGAVALPAASSVLGADRHRHDDRRFAHHLLDPGGGTTRLACVLCADHRQGAGRCCIAAAAHEIADRHQRARQRHACNIAAGTGAGIFDTIGAVDDHDQVVVKEVLEPTADVLIHPLRIVFLAHSLAWPGRLSPRFRPDATCVRRVRRSPAE